MQKSEPTQQVVCIGGGTGTFSVVSALKQLPVAITSVVAVSDSGGSTGRIRDEFGFQPVGDLRQSLAALADDHSQDWIKKLLLYRFEKGDGLKGHNLGNLILTALQDMVGDTTQALEIAGHVFQLQGRVVPVTQTAVDLKITYQDGTTAVGEHILDEPTQDPVPVASVALVPDCTINPAARDALTQADLIIIGPGDLYASLMACLVVDGLQETLTQSPAPILYVCNLMTRRTQTHNLSAAGHVAVIETALGKPVDYVLLNTKIIPENLIAQYAAEVEHPVRDDLKSDPRVIRAPVASTVAATQQSQDAVHRSLLRHDPTALRDVLQTLLQKI